MKEVNIKLLKSELDTVLSKYYNGSFIEHDPVSIPHLFSKKQDVEIAAFITAMISWGNRKAIINNARKLMKLMDDAPFDFIMNHEVKDLEKFSAFKHRTFQFVDLLGFIQVLKRHYSHFDSFESAFLTNGKFVDVKNSLSGFHNYFFNDSNIILNRTKKHISTPEKTPLVKD